MRQVPTTVDPLASQGAVAAAQALAALGHEARLAIFRSLVRAGDAGLAVHQIQQGLGGIPRSTLAHHLQMLVQAGLVEQRKVGAEVESRADFRAMRALVAYLTEECCADTWGAEERPGVRREVIAGRP
jgi:ArsR family transcriptional regulator, arsenate/arsenite/antimonite-responsive transcriptional repressor